MRYPSDMTDAQWDVIEPLIVDKSTIKWGRPREVDLRRVLDGIFYLNRTGCQWRYLPGDFPNWFVVYRYFRQWQKEDKWQAINETLSRQVRLDAKKK